MTLNEFQHTIPRFHLKNFADVKNNKGIYVCDIINGVKPTDCSYKKTNQDVGYGANNYYGQDIIKYITSDQLIISNFNIRIEDAFNRDFENEAAIIFKKILEDEEINLSSNEIYFLKKYCYIQHIRTEKTYQDFKSFFNSKGYDEIERLAIKQLGAKSGAEALKKYKNDFATKEGFLKQIFKKDSFFNFEIDTKIMTKNIYLLINNSPMPFVLSDSGIIWGGGENEDMGYLPLHPKYCLFLTNQNHPKKEINVDEEVKNINNNAWFSSYKQVFSNDKNYLQKLYDDNKDRKTTQNDEGFVSFE